MHNVQFEIISGSKFHKISDDLEAKGLIINRFYWDMHAKLLLLDEHVRFGEYQLTTDDTMHSMLNKFIRGEAILYSFTILPGSTMQQVLMKMNETSLIKKDAIDNTQLLQQLNIKQSSLEGLLFPDTYFYQKGTSHIKLLAQAHKKMQKILNDLWQNRVSGLPLKTPYEALILASIIEKESAEYNESKRIAGVFISRLLQKMLLQSDPTVIYGIKNYGGNIKKKDLKTDTPYNTYMRKGLPPTPISMPSLQSLQAAMMPHITDDLYFVAKNDGKHYFSKNYQDHKKAVIRYQLKR